MLEKLDNDLHANDDILFYNEYFDKVTFIANQRHIFVVDLDIIILIMIIILMKMILILLFTSDFWLDLVNLKNFKKRYKRRIDVYSIGS